MTYLNFPINPFFYKYFYIFLIFFFIYIKVFKYLSVKHYQENKERLQKKARERYQNLSIEEKEKSDNMIVNITKISQTIKKVNLLSIE